MKLLIQFSPDSFSSSFHPPGSPYRRRRPGRPTCTYVGSHPVARQTVQLAATITALVGAQR